MGKQSSRKKAQRLALEDEWTPLIRTVVPQSEYERVLANTDREKLKAMGVTEEQLRYSVMKAAQDETYRNNRYQVAVRRHEEVIHLSIRRLDRQPIHDWRDLQRIKNELVGPENEAVELYPAESRMVDTANQYHLWVMKDPAFRFPFGFNARLVSESEVVAGSQQRPRTNDNPK